MSFKKVVTVRYKAIDFDSSRRDGGTGASLRGPTSISNEFTVDDSTTMVTPGYVSPEQNFAFLGEVLTLEQMQDQVHLFHL